MKNTQRMLAATAASLFLVACGLEPQEAAPPEVTESPAEENTHSALADVIECGLKSRCSNPARYAAAYQYSALCGGTAGSINATACRLANGAAFVYKCGIGDCPSGGYFVSEYGYSSQCGAGNPNQTICERIE